MFVKFFKRYTLIGTNRLGQCPALIKGGQFQ